MAQQHVTVVARLGITVPIEGTPRQHITPDQPRRIRLTHYYRRQIKDGDLVIVPDASPTASPRKATGSSSTTPKQD